MLTANGSKKLNRSVWRDAKDGKRSESSGGEAPPKLAIEEKLLPLVLLQLKRRSLLIVGETTRVAPIVKVLVLSAVSVKVLGLAPERGTVFDGESLYLPNNTQR